MCRRVVPLLVHCWPWVLFSASDEGRPMGEAVVRMWGKRVIPGQGRDGQTCGRPKADG
ncbi:hypothetical protein GCM10023205_82680 [Yinghuangia aomiensis]|uniref:Secreted protein n=1 Tax=Yinghuangia aomiensis TaxID=676205 RepID=A0ABP9IFV1_9ACTN